MLKQITNEVAMPLSKLINISIQEGVFPICTKIAKVKPLIHESGEQDLFGNYRPISLVPAVLKS